MKLKFKICVFAALNILLLIFISFDSMADNAKSLGWTDKKNSPNLCGGYYQDLPLAVLNLPADLLQITADSSELHLDGRSLIKGHVVVNQAPDEQLIADRAYIYRNKASGEVTKLNLYGNVQMQEAGKYIVGKKAHLRPAAKQGDYYDALYRITLDPLVYSPSIKASSDKTGSYLTAYGHADQITQLSKGKLALTKATYTTCAPTIESWRLRAKKIDLNHDTGRGVAHDAVLSVKGLPVFYTPYFNFPLDKRRLSGFLFPLFGSSSRAGFNISIPYYWNIAPNYDATLTPTYYVKRGLQLNNLLRYLTPASSGMLRYSILPNDTGFGSFQRSAVIDYKAQPALPDLVSASRTRQYFSWQNKTAFNANWTSSIDYTRVSDDYYFQDFSNIPTVVMTNQLLQEARLNYNNQYLTFQGMFQKYQTLHPVTLGGVANPYARLPQLLFFTNYSDQKTGLLYQFSSELVRFRRSLLPGEQLDPIVANRINIQPGISLPFMGSAGYLTPMVQVNATQYDLTNQPSTYRNTISRAIPLFSLDSGVYFDRNLNLSGSNYQQTLEPRLFYLYVPYHEQYQIPLFDTGLQVFNYDQLYRTNRFSGIDRIGDANQVTIGLTTRFIDQNTGGEKFRASIGQIYYFSDRKVLQCGTAGCKDPINAVGVTSNTDSSSPIAGQMAYWINSQWNTSANLTWDPHTKRTQNGTLNLQYVHKTNQVINFGYNFIRYGDVDFSKPKNDITRNYNNLSQATISFTTPIGQNWRTVGGWTYNLSHEHAQSYFYGAEYNTCCWATRLVAATTFIGLNSYNAPQFNKAIYLQFLLKGMGNFGTNDPGLITNNIAGYQDNFGKI